MGTVVTAGSFLRPELSVSGVPQPGKLEAATLRQRGAKVLFAVLVPDGPRQK